VAAGDSIGQFQGELHFHPAAPNTTIHCYFSIRRLFVVESCDFEIWELSSAGNQSKACRNNRQLGAERPGAGMGVWGQGEELSITLTLKKDCGL